MGKICKNWHFFVYKGSQSGPGGPSCNISMGSSPWWLIPDIQLKLYARNKKKVTEQILRKLLNSLKICIFLLFCTTNRAQKDPFEYFNGVQLFTADRWYHTEAVCTKRKKVIKQFLRKWAKCVKIGIFAYGGSNLGPGWPPWSISMGSSSLWLIEDMIQKLYAQKEKKLLNSFWVNG